VTLPRLERGARLAEIHRTLHQHQAAIPAGCGPTVGIAGLALGGGLGVLGRTYGLTSYRLTAATFSVTSSRSLWEPTRPINEEMW
jgi:FAD/FMN-containing dehydrogenase